MAVTAYPWNDLADSTEFTPHQGGCMRAARSPRATVYRWVSTTTPENSKTDSKLDSELRDMKHEGNARTPGRHETHLFDASLRGRNEDHEAQERVARLCSLLCSVPIPTDPRRS